MVSILANDIIELVSQGAHLLRIGVSKRPARRWRWTPTTADEAIEWHVEGGTLGIMPSSLGMVVIDLDKALGRDDESITPEDVERFVSAYPPALTLKSASGVHLWYPDPTARECYEYRQKKSKTDCDHRNRDGLIMEDIQYDIRGVQRVREAALRRDSPHTLRGAAVPRYGFAGTSDTGHTRTPIRRGGAWRRAGAGRFLSAEQRARGDAQVQVVPGSDKGR